MITSNVSSLPEVAGDAAILVDPHSVVELRSSIERLLLSPDLRARLGSNGRIRAARFRWDACGKASWRFFERVFGRL